MYFLKKSMESNPSPALFTLLDQYVGSCGDYNEYVCLQ